MRLRWLSLLCLLPCAVAAQQKPRLAVLPLDAPSLERAQRARLSDVLFGAVAGTGAVQLAPTEDVAREYERKYQGSCPANDVLKCLAYLAEHTSSTYGLKVALKRGSRAKSWEWAAALAAYDGTVLPQPDVFPFMDTGDIVFDRLAEDTLKRYVETLNLKALPIVPTRPVVATDVPKVTPPDGTKVAPPVVTKPVEKPAPVAAWVVTGTGVAALGASAVFGILAASGQGSVGVTGDGYPVSNDDLARQQQVNQNATVSAVLGGVGVAATAAGILWLMGSGGDAAPGTATKPSVGVAPVPGGAVLVFGGAL